MHFDIREALTQEQQMSEAFILNVLLAASGGFQDAYTYMVRGHVYANAQTGNVVMMSTHLLTGEFSEGWRYFFPLLAFALGVFICEHIHMYTEIHHDKLHWRQIVVAVQAALLLAVGFMGQGLNLLANCVVSMTCAMQVQGFRTIHGYAYASTMCIGNIRSTMDALAHYTRSHDPAYLQRAGYYFGVIVAFAIGAGIGGNLCPRWGERSIWVCCVLLAVSFWLMGWKGRSRLKSIFKKYGW